MRRIRHGGNVRRSMGKAQQAKEISQNDQNFTWYDCDSSFMTGLVQLQKNDIRVVAMVAGNQLLIIPTARSIYDLALQAIAKNLRLFELVRDVTAAGTVLYDDVYEGHNDWKLLPAFDHPTEPARCFVTG